MAKMTTSSAKALARADMPDGGRFTLRSDNKILRQWRDGDGHLHPATIFPVRFKEGVDILPAFERFVARRGGTTVTRL